MGGGTSSLWANPVPLALIVVALGAFVFAVASALKAWSLSYGHPAFDALGLKKWVMGTFVIAYMPPVAIPYVKRYVAGFVVFILSFAALVVYAATSGTSLP